MDVNETRQARHPYYDPYASLLVLDQQCPLPYGWERCVDLQSGWIHFTDRITGIKTDVDPRKQYANNPSSHFGGGVPRSTIGSIPTTEYYDPKTTKRSTQSQIVQRGMAVNKCTLGFMESTREAAHTGGKVCTRSINKDGNQLIQAALSSRASPLCEMQESPSTSQESALISKLSSFKSVDPSNSFSSSTSSSPISSALSFWDDDEEITSHYVSIEPRNMAEDMASVMVAVGCTSCFMYIMLSKKDLRCPRCGTTCLLDFSTPHTYGINPMVEIEGDNRYAFS
ncbi:hypothetical protein O6H91_17G011400 [Diphasiastrum complanatum]|uniref:Uncharacterized protein n=2 Tax=Diphasiastrum complanatum TaxID=34168 RepID=A0ACC2B464_DIPCM|nr:hypothetical protein O6H91_17G011400 [Diphasiastrum complanatum]KAJ7524561.1 hypothetical protein O6H91_17G011400 [Diphasiastrum complanatum]